jgi:hypothetical protein
MLGIGSGSFDPETLVILETAFDEAWILSKVMAAVTSGPTSSHDESAISRWKESVIPCDCTIGRLWS